MRVLERFFGKTDKKKALSWAFFDFGNSAYSVLILSLVFPLYYKEVIAGPALGDFYWGLIGGIAVVLAGLLSPLVGAVMDYESKKKRKFIAVTLLAAFTASLLFFTNSNSLIFASIIFIISYFFFLLAQSIYDSFLAHFASKKSTGKISGLGYSLGYLGGIIVMLLLHPFYSRGYESPILYKLTFPLTALFFIIFSIPLFISLKDNHKRGKESLYNLVKISFRKVLDTLKGFKRRKNISLFLIAFYLMNDALVTIFAFTSLYAKQTLLLSISEIVIIALIVQVVAIPASLLFGALADKKGQKRILLFSIVVWIMVVILLVIAPPKNTLFAYIIAFLTGLTIGGSQSVARSWYSNIIPEKERFSLFGFNSFASKVSAVIGPLLFGAISSFMGNQRLAMFSLLFFFVASFLLFIRVKEK
ncbi:MAG: MFS transporter [Nanoarchaeota archaeon]|nr:MFS transporter [Nanoarchaeota archaeon]